MTFNAKITGKVTWSCDECGAKAETMSANHATNMRKHDLQLNVTPPAGWTVIIDEYGRLHRCPKCSSGKEDLDSKLPSILLFLALVGLTILAGV